MDEEYWDEDVRSFLEQLPPDELRKVRDVMRQLADEILEAQDEESDVLFCGSTGTHIIKCLHYPASALGFEEPRQLPSGNDLIYLFAVSDEFIDREVDSIKNLYSDPQVQQEQWEKYLNTMASRLNFQAVADTMPGFETLLENE
jgi:hypothetical protein